MAVERWSDVQYNCSNWFDGIMDQLLRDPAIAPTNYIPLSHTGHYQRACRDQFPSDGRLIEFAFVFMWEVSPLRIGDPKPQIAVKTPHGRSLEFGPEILSI
jgi:hypothetical protein